MTAATTLRVLVVEDSAAARRLLVHIVNGDSEMRVVGEAADGDEAVTLAGRLKPDVILMDIGLPKTDGLEATRTIMASCPTPIVLISANYVRSDAHKTFEALAAGALTVLPKPQGPGTHGFAEAAANLTITLKLMAEVKLVRRRATSRSSPGPRTPVKPRLVRDAEVVGIAASTGGPAALAAILAELPGSTSLPIVVVQHITIGFHDGLVRWLDSVTPLRVRLAQEGDALRAGEILVAPPDRHLAVTRRRCVELSADAPIRGHRPSATRLFLSLAEAYGGGAVGVILTGMGDDGVAGLQALKKAGGIVIAQDQATSVVYGMPREAVALGVADYVLPVDGIAATLNTLMDGGRS